MKKVIVVAICSLMSGCINNPFYKHPTFKADKFEVFASPRTFDAPGRIYRMDPSGQIFGVIDLEVNVKTGDETIPRFEKDTQLSFSEILKNIGVADQTPITMSLTALKKQKIVYEGINAQREYTNDSEIDEVLQSSLQKVQIRPDNDYFLIRETISTNEINYKLDKSVILRAGLEGKFKDLVKNDTTLGWQSKNKITLNRKFDKPMRIAYKAELLKFKKPNGTLLFSIYRSLGGLGVIGAHSEPVSLKAEPAIIERVPTNKILNIPAETLIKP